MKHTKIGLLPKIYLLVATVVFLFPFYICILTSVKSKQDVGGLLSFPKTIHWENFSTAIEKANIWMSMKNSIIITFCSVVSARVGFCGICDCKTVPEKILPYL